MEIEKTLLVKWFLSDDFDELDPKCQKKIEQYLGSLYENEKILYIAGTPKNFLISQTPYAVLTNKGILNIDLPEEVFQCLYTDITEISLKPGTIFGDEASKKGSEFKLGGLIPTVVVGGTAHKVFHYNNGAVLAHGIKNKLMAALKENWLKSKQTSN